MANIPKITQDFVSMIEKKAISGTYRVHLNGFLIDVFPYVFPPESSFSKSTKTVYDYLGSLDGQTVLDMGTGTGVQAIESVFRGAKEVDAVDIYGGAVECAKHNVKLNRLEHKIKVWQSDLFDNVPGKQYDLIIANLPILDFSQEDIKLHSLFDPRFKYHSRLFNESSQYLSPHGKIVLCHANLNDASSFARLEALAKGNNFRGEIKQLIESMGYEWRNYEFKYMVSV